MSNSVTVVGNLTRDPELRYTPSGTALAKFGIAVNRFYTDRSGERREQTDFFNVNAWRSLAENVAETCKTGTRVIVSGRVQSRSWETEEGQRRTVVEIEADEVGPSLRWATAAVTKTPRGGPGEWQNAGGSGDSSSDDSSSNDTTEGSTEPAAASVSAAESNEEYSGGS